MSRDSVFMRMGGVHLVWNLPHPHVVGTIFSYIDFNFCEEFFRRKITVIFVSALSVSTIDSPHHISYYFFEVLAYYLDAASSGPVPVVVPPSVHIVAFVFAVAVADVYVDVAACAV
jgi:hypothetical protein